MNLIVVVMPPAQEYDLYTLILVTFWAWIENHQTLTVGIIGLSGVIATLLYNARQVGIQRRKELFHERQTLRVALAEELKINRKAFRKSIKILTADQKGGGAGYWVPTDQMDDAYRSFIDRIGLLSESEVRQVMNVYLTLRAYTATLPLIIHENKAGETGGRYVPVPFQSALTLIEIQKNLIGPLDAAIDAIGIFKAADRV